MFFKNLFLPVVLLGVLKQNLGSDACKKNKNKQNKTKTKLLGYWFFHVLSKLKKTLNGDV